MTTDRNTPFRLILHIGAGKTGTSSIQKTLLHNSDEIGKQGTAYLGMVLENATEKKFSWQKKGGSREFHQLNAEQAKQQALEVLRSTIASLSESGYKQAIWSNEWFFKRPSPIMEIAQELSAEGVDIHVVAYVRRHDSWVRSAYVQWGLKHKTYKGKIKPFSKWVNVSKVGFASHLAPWVDLFNDKVFIRNLDVLGDAVGDFLEISGISSEFIDKKNTNETPSGEELVLRTMFNDQFNGNQRLGLFNKLLGHKNLCTDIPIEQWLDTLLPTSSDLHQVAEACADDREELNRMLETAGQQPIETTPLSAKSISVNSNQILTAVSQLVLKQAVKIDELERRVATMNSSNEKPASVRVVNPSNEKSMREQSNKLSNCPVFAISTGRSGSTLVQRVLNCHKDLVMWGEHYGFLNGLAGVYVQMSNPEQSIYPRKPEDNMGVTKLLPTLQDPAAPLEWTNPWSLKEFKPQIRQFIENYFAGRLEAGQRWGFKEIRYNSLPTLRMLKDLYPQGRFIFIQRDAQDVTRSKVFAFIKESKWSNYSDAEKSKRIENMLNDVNEHYRIYAKFMERNPGLGLVVNYEELVADPKAVTAQMLDHLNLDPERFDWDLGDQVMGNIITKTKRDDEVIELIRAVADKMADENS